MFGNNVTLFEFLGFRVRANVSWVFLAILVTWSLAQGFFPTVYPGFTPLTYWSMGLVGMFGLFFSLLFHEFSHSLVARARGLPIRGITLFLFGGVAEMAEEPKDAKTEFWMAIAGPLASVFLGVVFYGLSALLSGLGVPEHAAGIARYLGFINLLLAAFNMVPGFPLDGGRVLRALLWHWKGDLRWATRVASMVGQGFGLLLVALGIINAISGNVIGGIWWLLIGLFLRAAASAAYQQLVAHQTFEGKPVSRYMTRDPVTVPPDLVVRRFVEDYLYRHSFDFYPVTEQDRLVGCVGSAQVKGLSGTAWEEARVADIMLPCDEQNSVTAGSDAGDALSIMQKTGNSRLLVTEGGRLVGILVLKDLLHYLQLKAELEGELG